MEIEQASRHGYVHRIEIPMDKNTNLQMMCNVSCTDEEHTTIGHWYTFPLGLCSSSSRSWFFFGKWSVTEDDVDYEFNDYMDLFTPRRPECVALQHKRTIKILLVVRRRLLWHFRLGISVFNVLQLITHEGTHCNAT